MERLVRFLDIVGDRLDRALPANRGVRRLIGFTTLWIVVTAVMYFLPGTQYSPESDSHIHGHLDRSAAVATFLTLLGFLVFLWQNPDA
jgi:hypothetical protein